MLPLSMPLLLSFHGSGVTVDQLPLLAEFVDVDEFRSGALIGEVEEHCVFDSPSNEPSAESMADGDRTVHPG